MGQAAPALPLVDPRLGSFIDALAVALARRDHAADLAARRTQDKPDAPRSPVQPVQL